MNAISKEFFLGEFVHFQFEQEGTREVVRDKIPSNSQSLM